MLWEKRMFDIAVFADDIDQDLGRALDVVAEFGLEWVEIRSAWGVNLMDHTDEKVRQVFQATQTRGLRVPCIPAPLFKSRLGGRGQVSKELFHAQQRDDLELQMTLLRRAAEIAHIFGTELVRCFSFWRIEPRAPGIGHDPAAIWSEMLEPFHQAVRAAEQEGIVLVLENDFECNLGSGAETARFIEEIGSPHLWLLWDPGNAQFVGEQAFPDGYDAGKHLIGHVHLKDATRDPQTGEPRWVPVGSGEVNLLGQLRALKADGYEGVATMENHYVPPGGSKEEGVRESFAGLQRLMAGVE
jgi:sugar phosphate isomerase/epimerase